MNCGLSPRCPAVTIRERTSGPARRQDEPMSDRAKDAEILTLRHRIMVLQRQLHGQKIRFTPANRALLAALLHRLPRAVLRQIRLLVRSCCQHGRSANGASQVDDIG